MSGDGSRKVLIVGAGEAGRMIASEINRSEELGATVEGYLDDDASLAGVEFEGAPVLGGTAELESVVTERGIDEVIISIPTAPGRFVRDIVRRCRRAGVEYKIVPGVMEIIRGTVHIDQVREVRVEDLLGRLGQVASHGVRYGAGVVDGVVPRLDDGDLSSPAHSPGVASGCYARRAVADDHYPLATQRGHHRLDRI